MKDMTLGLHHYQTSHQYRHTK